MKTLPSLILLLFTLSTSAQQPGIIQLDSCKQYASANTSAFDEMFVRVEQPAQWNNSKTSLNEFFDTFFKQYVQKKAGGRITLSLLISKDGKCCFYQVQPNSNVRPDYKALKQLIDQSTWLPARQNGVAVTSAKVLFINFNGKKISVTTFD